MTWFLRNHSWERKRSCSQHTCLALLSILILTLCASRLMAHPEVSVTGELIVLTSREGQKGNLEQANVRLRLSEQLIMGPSRGKATVDLNIPTLRLNSDISLRRGTGWADLREAWWEAPWREFAHFTIGRQIRSWGVGDLRHVNDPFPKDWGSFLFGRGEAFVNAPADMALISLYGPRVNLDVALLPWLIPDRSVDSAGLVYWNPFEGRLAGPDEPLSDLYTDKVYDRQKVAARLYGYWGTSEWAVYAHHGFANSPDVLLIPAAQLDFSEETSFGGSWRMRREHFVLYGETAFLRRSPPSGSVMLLHDEMRFLGGALIPIPAKWDLTIQADYREAKAPSTPPTAILPEASFPSRRRDTLMLRLERSAWHDDLRFSLAGLYSTVDSDYLVNPRVTWRSPYGMLELSILLAGGNQANTYLGQLDKNDTAYMAFTRHF